MNYAVSIPILANFRNGTRLKKTIRMKSKDIIELYDVIGPGTEVHIVERSLREGIETLEPEPLREEIDLSIPLPASYDFNLLSNPVDREVVGEEILVDIGLSSEVIDVNAGAPGEFELAPAWIDPLPSR